MSAIGAAGALWAGWPLLAGPPPHAGLLPASQQAWWVANPAALDWQPALAGAQPWRAVTAAWVHLSAVHLGANLGGTAVVAALGAAAGCGQRAALAWAAAWPLTHLALLAQPALARYGGLSGVLHAGVAVAVVQLLRGERGPRQAVGGLLAMGLLLKLALEAPWQGPLRHAAGWDIAIAPGAHVAGAMAGAVCAWVCGVGAVAPRQSDGP